MRAGDRETARYYMFNKPGRRAIVPVSLYFFNSLHTALTLTYTPSSLSNSTIVVDLYPFAIKWYSE